MPMNQSSIKIAGADPITGVEANFVSATAAGALVVDGSAVIQPVSGTVTANAGTNLNTSLLALDSTLTNKTQFTKITDGTDIALVTAVGDLSTTTTNRTTNFTFSAATQTIAIDTNGCSTVQVNIVLATLTPNWNFVPEGFDGTNWITASIYKTFAYGTTSQQLASVMIGNSTANLGLYTVNVAGFSQFRLRCSSISGGTITAYLNASSGISQWVQAQAPAIVVGTQGLFGYSVQNLKDAGRNQTNYFMAVQVVSTATDTLMSLTGFKSGVAVGATTTPAVVTVTKTYRINSVTIDYTTIITTPGSVRFTLRANTSGVVAITSPAVCTWEVGEPSGIAPVAGKKNTITITLPDGMEFFAGTGIGISMVGLNTVGAAAVVGYGRITINGYEY